MIDFEKEIANANKPPSTPQWDGNRPLAVQIMWKINQSGKLDADYIFDKPLLLKGNEVANNLLITLRTLGLQNTTHLNHNDIANPSWVHI